MPFSSLYCWKLCHVSSKLNYKKRRQKNNKHLKTKHRLKGAVMLCSVSMPSETVNSWQVGEWFNIHFEVSKTSKYLALKITNFKREK